MEERTGKCKQNCHHSKNCKHLPFGNDSFHYNVFYLHKMHRRSIEHLDFDSNTQSLVSIRSFHELEHAHCTHQTNKHINKSICYKRPNGILDFSPTNHERKWHAFAKLGQLTVTCVQISWLAIPIYYNSHSECSFMIEWILRRRAANKLKQLISALASYTHLCIMDCY